MAQKKTSSPRHAERRNGREEMSSGDQDPEAEKTGYGSMKKLEVELAEDGNRIPDHQSARASLPIPKDGAVSPPSDAVMMFLIAYRGLKAGVYVGNRDNLVYAATQDSPEYEATLPLRTSCHKRNGSILGKKKCRIT
jgi:hypothetical protein